MKITMIIVRSLLGLLFLFSSITYFFKLIPTPPLEGNLKLFTDGLLAAGYLMPLVKAVELVCGVAFIMGRYVPLAAVVIFPISINVVLIHSFLAPAGLPMAGFALLANLFLAYYYRERYQGLLVSR